MCGILGMHTANKSGYYADDVTAFKNMLLMTSLRGRHSTGVFGISKYDHSKDRVNIVKVVGSPFYLEDYDKSEEFYRRMISSFGTAVGHCRYATRGEVTARNAHPFKEGNITLVHNGMISNFTDLHDKDKHKDIVVDSHLVAKLFEEEGAEAILPRLFGAYTLLWWDSTDGTLNVARNAQRPLFVAATDKQGLIFSSEKETLAWNAWRHNFTYDSINEIPVFTHLKFKQGSIEPEVKQYKEQYKVYPKSVPQTTPANTTKQEEEKKGQVVPFREQRRHRGKPLDSVQTITLARIQHKQERILEVDDRLDLQLLDGDRVGGKLTLSAYSDDYPNVEFCAIVNPDISDDQLLATSYLRGSVASIFPAKPDMTARKVPWKVWLTQVLLVGEDASLLFAGFTKYDSSLDEDLQPDLKEEPNTDIVVQDDDAGFAAAEIVLGEEEALYAGTGTQQVTLLNTLGTHTHLSSQRYMDFVRQGCKWCDEPIPEEHYKQPQKLLYHCNYPNGDGIVCMDCTNGYHNKH